MYNITGNITNQNNTEALATIVFLRDNYAAKIKAAKVNGTNKTVSFTLLETDYSTAVNIMTNLIQTYNTRFTDWQFLYTPDAG